MEPCVLTAEMPHDTLRADRDSSRQLSTYTACAVCCGRRDGDERCKNL